MILEFVEKVIDEFVTDSDYGFNPREVQEIITIVSKKYPFNTEKFYEAVSGDTCILQNGVPIRYHCDILKGLICGIEDRCIKLSEFD